MRSDKLELIAFLCPRVYNSLKITDKSAMLYIALFTEDRTITSVLNQLLYTALSQYQPMWIPGKHHNRLNEHAQHVLTIAHEKEMSNAF